jgi:hypothetical protein
MGFGLSASLEVNRPTPVHDASPSAQWVWIATCKCTFPSSNDQKGAPISHTHAPIDGGPHSEEGDRSVQSGGVFR